MKLKPTTVHVVPCICFYSNFSLFVVLDEIWRHVPAYHINWPAEVSTAHLECPICKKRPNSNCPLQVHIHEDHGPLARNYRAIHNSHHPTPGKLFTQLYNFSLVVCRHPHTGKFLLCQGG